MALVSHGGLSVPLDAVVMSDDRAAGPTEWARFFRSSDLPGAEVLHARFVVHRYAPHVHDTWTIAEVEFGAASFDLASSRHVAAAGSVFLIPPGVVHTGEPAIPGGYVYRVLYLEPEHVGVDGGPRALARPSPSPGAYPVVMQNGILTARLARLHRLLALRGHALEQGEALALAITALEKIMSPPGAAGPAAQRPVTLAADFIQAHWHEDFSLGDLARVAGASRYHLVRTFHREMGMPPSAYRRALRVATAQQLLRDGQRPADVAASCGFYDQSHLNRHFKLAVGVTPAQYVRA
jgi:AraC-like DNA-binding protein